MLATTRTTLVVMSLLIFLWYALLAVWTVSFRRWRQGPLRPRWSWGFELVVATQKRFHRRVAQLDPITERQLWAGLRARGPAERQVEQRSLLLGGVSATWYEPRAGASDRVLLYLHGGGFVNGSRRSHGELCAGIALASQARLLFIDYRLAPEHSFPAALDDVQAVYRALLASGLSAAQLVLMGDSAGGNLALSLLAQLRTLGLPLPAAAVALCPWVDMTASGGSLERNAPFDWGEPWMFERWRKLYTSGADPADPRVSPARAELAGLPPLFLAVGSAEMLYDQVLAFAARAEQAGVHVTLDVEEDGIHNWHVLAPTFPHLQRGIERIGSFVRGLTRTPGSSAR
ncbi:MAG: hypothetical protein RL685_4790 [Pseudomonadota bacterium]